MNEQNEKELMLVEYIKSLKALEDAMEPFKDQRRDLKKSYQENGWLTRDEISLAVKAYRLMKSGDDLDDLYTVDINPIRSFANTAGPIVFGQKTLQVAASALDRVNVRRLLIDVRRTVKQIAQTLIFEPNREATLQRFTAAVTPRLKRVQQLQGIERFKVVIDTTTTTQADVENNTIRGKIFLQPTRAVEFISLDFVVTNAGADI